MILQVEQAAGLFSQTAQLGIVFTLLCAIVLVLGWLVVKLYKESKDKSVAHGETLAAKEDAHTALIKIKDDKIEELHEKNHNLALKNVETMKDWIEAMRSLRNS